jgi:hypothetical protein
MMLKWFKGFHFELQTFMIFERDNNVTSLQIMIIMHVIANNNLKKAKGAKVKILLQRLHLT